MHGDFVWIDLSTFDVKNATGFYQRVFGWKPDPDPSGYVNCHLGQSPVAGIYEMPAFFQGINMPSFWMSYIQVDDVDAVAQLAGELGGKVEIEEENALGRVALIRDPAGAGFTCFEGHAPGGRSDSLSGGWCWSELFVSDRRKVEPFYSALFGWQFLEEGHDRYGIQSRNGQRIASLQEAGNEVKGDKEFWAVYIASSDLEQSKSAVRNAGGEIGAEFQNAEGKQLLVYDDQGAAIFVSQRPVSGKRGSETFHPGVKWRSAVGLIGIYLIILLDIPRAWGLLFLLWVLPDLKSGTTCFIEPLDRRTNPVLYWAVVLTWLWLAVYLLVAQAT